MYYILKTCRNKIFDKEAQGKCLGTKLYDIFFQKATETQSKEKRDLKIRNTTTSIYPKAFSFSFIL